MAGRFSVEAVFKAVDRITAPVKRMQSRVGKFTRTMGRGFRRLNRSVNKFATGIKRASVAAAASLVIIGVAMASAINTGADFEQTLVNAAAKFPGEIRRGTAAFQQLEDAARKAGSTTEFTATQSAEALNFLAMAGFNAESAISSLPTVINLATAGAIDLGMAADIATDSLGAFNLLSKDAATNQRNLARVSDVLALTTIRANTNMEQLFEALKDAAPVGVAAGQSIEAIAAAAGILANAGIKGTRAGTALKNMFLAISAPGSRAGKIMNALGVQTKNADGSLRGVVDVMADFQKAANKLPEGDRLAVFKEIFGKLSVAGAINLANSTKEMANLQKELENSAGAVTTLANVMRDSTRGRIDSLTSAIEGATISLFKMKQDGLEGVLDSLVGYVRIIDGAISSNKEFGQALFSDVTDVLIGGGKALGVFIGLLIVLKTTLLVVNVILGVSRLAMMALTAAMFLARITGLLWVASLVAGSVAVVALGVKTAAMAAILNFARAAVLAFNIALAMNPIGVMVIAIGLLIAAAALLILNWDKVKMFFVGLWATLSETVSTAIDTMKDKIGGLIAPFDQFFAGVKGLSDKFNALNLFGDKEVKVDMVAGAKVPTGLDSIDMTTNANAIMRGSSANDEDTAQPAGGAQVVSPQERIARTIEEERSTSSAEVIIRDETGRAEVASGEMGKNVQLKSSGNF